MGDSLFVGHQIRCPRCNILQDQLSYFVFERSEAYAHELNVVLKCRAKVPNKRTGKLEACRNVFSPGVPDRELLGV